MAIGPINQHQRKVSAAQRRRLEVLEVQAAELGSGTPPQIRTEIEDLHRALAGAIADVEPISEEERYRATMRAVMLLSQQLAAVEVKVGRLYWVLPLLLFLYLFVSFVLDRL